MYPTIEKQAKTFGVLQYLSSFVTRTMHHEEYHDMYSVVEVNWCIFAICYNDFMCAYTHIDGCVHKCVRTVSMKTQWAGSSE